MVGFSPICNFLHYDMLNLEIPILKSKTGVYMKKMSIIEIKKRAKVLGLALLKTAKKAEIIRSIQAAEGNCPCFGTGIAESCGQGKCCWRQDCLEA